MMIHPDHLDNAHVRHTGSDDQYTFQNFLLNQDKSIHSASNTEIVMILKCDIYQT